jgi:hypothetical protein
VSEGNLSAQPVAINIKCSHELNLPQTAVWNILRKCMLASCSRHRFRTQTVNINDMISAIFFK